jgi:hypothetical protein
MSFTQAYGSILLSSIQNYKGAKNKKAQKGVVETATNAILNCRNLLEEQGLDLLQNLKAVCPTLFFLLTRINTGHQVAYQRLLQKRTEPNGRDIRGPPQTC